MMKLILLECGQNEAWPDAVSWSDWNILESRISRKNWRVSLIFCMWFKFYKKGWFHYFSLGVVRNGFDCIQLHLVWDCEILELNLKRKLMNQSIFPCWFSSMKEKSWWHHFDLSVVKNAISWSYWRICKLTAHIL